MSSLPYLDAAAVRAALPWETAVNGLETALATDVDPENDGPRLFAPTNHGEFLIMPATTPAAVGVKVLTVSPDNPAKGWEKIQGTYLLFDSETSAPRAVMDGTELTAIRTPTVTLTAVRALAAADPDFPEAPNVLVFGAGIQALNHIDAVAWQWPKARFSVIGRRPERVQALIADSAALGNTVVDTGADPEPAIRAADIILTLTSSSTPIFNGDLVADNAIVAAVGQHGLGMRELEEGLVRRSDALAEGRASMLREGGDMIPARSVEEWEEIQPPNLADAVAGRITRTPGKPAVYCGIGMSWEDLVLASLAYTESESVR